MGWFSRNIGKIRAVCAAVAFIVPGAAGAFLAVSELMNMAGWKFEDAELSPQDAAILDPWAVQFATFYDRLLKMLGNAQNAADLNTIKSYCCTMLNQYMWDDMNLSREGITARDNFIYKTFSALDAGIHVRSQELNVPEGKYWANVNTAAYNDPIYNGTLRIEVIECDHYTAGQNVQPTTIPVYNGTVPTPNVPTPNVPSPTKPTGTIRPSRPSDFDEYTGGVITPVKPNNTGCISGDCGGTTPVKSSGGLTPTKPTPIYEPIQPGAPAVDAQGMDQEEEEEEGNFFSRNKTAISILAALIVAKQLFSKK